jgi:predicted ferric reductase
MTTTASGRATRTGTPPAVVAERVLVAVVAANVILAWVLFFTEGEQKNTFIGIGKLFGLHIGLLLMLQLTLIARLPWLDRRLGMDRLTRWHRWVGFSLLWAVVLHFTFIILGFAEIDGSPQAAFTSLAGVAASLVGMLAAAILVSVAVLSMRAIRRRLGYETWHAIHMLMYVAVGLGLYHQFKEMTTFRQNPVTSAYWWVLWTLVVVALFVGRVGVPVWRNAYHRYTVSEVVPEADDVVSVHVTGRHLDRLPVRAGQFFIWRFPAFNGWWQANPFSMSKAPDGRSLRLTAKAVGKTSAGLRNLPVGTRVFVEGPYGAFTSLHQRTEGVVLVAGGVGVTPIRSLLEETKGPAVVLYRVRDEADAVLLPELRELAATRGAQVHVLSGRTGAGSPPNRPFDAANLAALVPDITERDVYVCGPPAMTASVLQSLRELDVPRRQVHAERFSLA